MSAVMVKQESHSISEINTDLNDVVELRNIHVNLDGKDILGTTEEPLNFLIEDKPNQGQFICLLGESGCGKSTLFNVMAGLLPPTSGEVLISGSARNPDYHINTVFQKYPLFEWLTAIENIELPLKWRNVPEKERREYARLMMASVGLEGHENKYVTQLSGGQQQRVSIGRSLITNPNIILMDEPFGALDVKTRIETQMFLKNLWLQSNLTIVFVTHNPDEAVLLGDDIYIMKANPGRITNYMNIALPLDRTSKIKKDPVFIQYVDEIEQLLLGN